jgi:hypothetical protein
MLNLSAPLQRVLRAIAANIGALLAYSTHEPPR